MLTPRALAFLLAIASVLPLRAEPTTLPSATHPTEDPAVVLAAATEDGQTALLWERLVYEKGTVLKRVILLSRLDERGEVLEPAATVLEVRATYHEPRAVALAGCGGIWLAVWEHGADRGLRLARVDRRGRRLDESVQRFGRYSAGEPALACAEGTGLLVWRNRQENTIRAAKVVEGLPGELFVVAGEAEQRAPALEQPGPQPLEPQIDRNYPGGGPAPGPPGPGGPARLGGPARPGGVPSDGASELESAQVPDRRPGRGVQPTLPRRLVSRFSPSVAFGAGRFLVTWLEQDAQERAEVLGRRYDIELKPIDPKPRSLQRKGPYVRGEKPDHLSRPRVAGSPWGYLLLWEGGETHEAHPLRARRLGADLRALDRRPLELATLGRTLEAHVGQGSLLQTTQAHGVAHHGKQWVVAWPRLEVRHDEGQKVDRWTFLGVERRALPRRGGAPGKSSLRWMPEGEPGDPKTVPTLLTGGVVLAGGPAGPTAFFSTLPVQHVQHQRKNLARGPGAVRALCVGPPSRACTPEARVVSRGAGRQSQPALAPLGEGYLVAWWESRGDLSRGLFARRVDAEGRAREARPELLLDEHRSGRIGRIRIVSLGEEALVLWTRASELRARRISARGGALAGENLIVGSPVYPDDFAAAVATDEEGRRQVIVLWATSGGKLQASRIIGTRVEPPLLVATEKKVRAVAATCEAELCHLAWLAVLDPGAKPWPHVSVRGALLRGEAIEPVNGTPSAGAERISRAQLHLAANDGRALLIWESHRHQDHNAQGRIAGPGGAAHTMLFPFGKVFESSGSGAFPSDLRGGRDLVAAGAGWLACSSFRTYGSYPVHTVSCYRLALRPRGERFDLLWQPVLSSLDGEDPVVAYHPDLEGHGGLVAWQALDEVTGTLRLRLAPLPPPAQDAPGELGD